MARKTGSTANTYLDVNTLLPDVGDPRPEALNGLVTEEAVKRTGLRGKHAKDGEACLEEADQFKHAGAERGAVSARPPFGRVTTAGSGGGGRRG